MGAEGKKCNKGAREIAKNPQNVKVRREGRHRVGCTPARKAKTLGSNHRSLRCPFTPTWPITPAAVPPPVHAHRVDSRRPTGDAGGGTSLPCGDLSPSLLGRRASARPSARLDSRGGTSQDVRKVKNVGTRTRRATRAPRSDSVSDRGAHVPRDGPPRQARSSSSEGGRTRPATSGKPRVARCRRHFPLRSFSLGCVSRRRRAILASASRALCRSVRPRARAPRERTLDFGRVPDAASRAPIRSTRSFGRHPVFWYFFLTRVVHVSRRRR